MEKLSDNIRRVLKRILEDLKSRESISSIGLFGSWSRGDAVSSSDVDILVVENRVFNYEYVERAEIDNLFFDLDYIPEKWIQTLIPPEIDQKLYEAHILYDRTDTLTKVKDLAVRIHWKPERVEIRTGSYLMEADIYLSRGLSAYNKDDFHSAKVYSTISLEAIMKVLLEVNKLSFSNSHFIKALVSSTEVINNNKLYKDYLSIAGFSKVDKRRCEKMLDSLSVMWRESINFVKANSPTLGRLHVRVFNDLNYYCRDSFLKGMSARTSSLIKDGRFTEAAHYMFRTSISMLENYGWLISILEETQFDYITLFQGLKGSHVSPEEIYQKAVEMFGIEEVSGLEAEESLRTAREIILRIRQKRKELIARLLA